MSRRRAARPAPCGSALEIQVFLDRRGFSPGEIDGHIGANAARALKAFAEATGLLTAGRTRPDCETWEALRDGLGEATTEYTVRASDVAGPFVRVPPDLMAQATLPALSYQSVEEQLAERFHASPALLRRLNPRARFDQAGQRLIVPNVSPFEAAGRVAAAAESGRRIDVSKRDGWLRVLDADGQLLFHAPVSSGSQHDPLPLGEWRVTNVAWQPVFHYNPELFWDADGSHARATIQPGPNGPVGLAWLGINVEHYGIHGTAHPERVGHAESHGCVRLTNWDVAHLLTLVRPGTPVTFHE